MQTERLDDKGSKVYTTHRIADARSATEVRVVRREGIAYVLCKETASSPYRVMCQIDVGVHDIPAAGVRFDVQTGGAGLRSEVLWKHLEVRADKINPGASKTSSEGSSLLKSLLDIFN